MPEFAACRADGILLPADGRAMWDVTPETSYKIVQKYDEISVYPLSFSIFFLKNCVSLLFFSLFHL